MFLNRASILNVKGLRDVMALLHDVAGGVSPKKGIADQQLARSPVEVCELRHIRANIKSSKPSPRKPGQFGLPATS
jgi:hypothetical protein